MAREKGLTGGLSLDRALMEAGGAGVVSGRFGWEGARARWRGGEEGQCARNRKGILENRPMKSLISEIPKQEGMVSSSPILLI